MYVCQQPLRDTNSLTKPSRAPENFLSAAELMQHPEYKHLLWPLEPSKSGYATVGEGRGGPFKLYYEIHGTGPTHLVFIMGLGGLLTTWQRQTKDFAHGGQNKYSVLIFDNRGVGKSDKPFMRYTTSEMAQDVYELTQHVGWTEPRSLNVIGVSMGGMIAQELAYAYPKLIGSVVLMSTAARLVNTVGFFENLWRRVLMFMPKSPDSQLAFVQPLLFSDTWLWAPDEINGAFKYNRDRFAAGELSKRSNKESFTFTGFALQAIAANWHHKSGEQLDELAEKVGRGRILVLHGEIDQMITVPHGHILAAELGEGVKSVFYPDVGHCIMIERRKELVKLVDELVSRTAALSS